MSSSRHALILILLAIAPAVPAAEPVTVQPPATRPATTWQSAWRQQAVHYASQIADPQARGLAHYELVYPVARAGELEAGRTLAELGREDELRRWVEEAQSPAARAYLCMGAAEAER